MSRSLNARVGVPNETIDAMIPIRTISFGRQLVVTSGGSDTRVHVAFIVIIYDARKFYCAAESDRENASLSFYCRGPVHLVRVTGTHAQDARV